MGGAAIQWLRDGLGILKTSAEVEKLAAKVPDAGGVYFVPAFVGLGTPHWDPYARGAIFGLERGTTREHIARATVESLAYQTSDVVTAMLQDASLKLKELRVDGGATINDSLMQFQSDLLGVKVKRPVVAETTALGAAYLAGLGTGFWRSTKDVTDNWALDREFTANLRPAQRKKLLAGWGRAVERVRGWAE